MRTCAFYPQTSIFFLQEIIGCAYVHPYPIYAGSAPCLIFWIEFCLQGLIPVLPQWPSGSSKLQFYSPAKLLGLVAWFGFILLNLDRFASSWVGGLNDSDRKFLIGVPFSSLRDRINLLVLLEHGFSSINYASHILNFASSLLISKLKLEPATRLGAINCMY